MTTTLKRIEAGEYEGEILGVPVRITRTACGTHPAYGTFSRQPNWTARATVNGSRVIVASGHGTLAGCAESAERTIAFRGLAKSA